MIKIRLGGWPFVLPQRWDEVTPAQAKELANTKPEQLRARLRILGKIPDAEHIKLDADVVLAAYEIISFIEELPEIVPNKHDLGDLLKWISEKWTFAEFETARAVLIKHSNELSTSLYDLAEIKGMQDDYLEIGSKILDGINLFTQQYEPFGIYEPKEPTVHEELAGIHKLQAFGAYPILEQIAAKYGKLPEEIEVKPVGWVMLEYVYNFAQSEFTENMRKLQANK